MSACVQKSKYSHFHKSHTSIFNTLLFKIYCMLILSKCITLMCRISTYLAAAFSIKPSSFSLPIFGFFSFLPSSFTVPFLFLVSVCSLDCKRKAKCRGRWRKFCEICQIQNKKRIFQSILMSQCMWKSTWNKLSTSVRCATILLSVGFVTVPPRGKSSSTDAMFEIALNVYTNQSPRQTSVAKHRTRFRPNATKPVAIKFDFKSEVSRENDEITNS